MICILFLDYCVCYNMLCILFPVIQVWNMTDLTLVYQSPILTASPFLCLAMSYTEPRVAVGAADGVVSVAH